MSTNNLKDLKKCSFKYQIQLHVVESPFSYSIDLMVEYTYTFLINIPFKSRNSSQSQWNDVLVRQTEFVFQRHFEKKNQYVIKFLIFSQFYNWIYILGICWNWKIHRIYIYGMATMSCLNLFYSIWMCLNNIARVQIVYNYW